MQNLHRSTKVRWAITRAALVALLSVLLASCTTTKKALKQFDKEPNAFAEKCAAYFPFIPSSVTHYDTILKANNSDYRGVIDSLSNQSQLLADSIESACNDRESGMSAYYRKELLLMQRQVAGLKALYKPCEPEIIKVNQIDSIEATGKTKALEGQNKTLQSENDKKDGIIQTLKEKIKSKNQWALWLILLVVAQSLWIFRKPLLALIKL